MAVRASSKLGTSRPRLLAGLPVAERRLVLSGVSTAVLEGGDGSPLVLLHGGIECGAAVWAPALSRLAERHRVVVPDLPGLGESAPLAQLGDEPLAEWFDELLHATCDERPALVAHSLGGALALRFALRRTRFRHLVLYGTPAVGPYRMPPGLMVSGIRFGLRPSPANLGRLERWAFLDVDRTKQRAPDWFEAFDAYCVSRGSVSHVKRTMRRLIRTGTKAVPDDELGRIDVPTTLVWGRYDRMVPLRLAEGASARLRWPLHVIEDAGHVPHLEQPDPFVRALSEALAT